MSKLSQSLAAFCLAVSLAAIALANDAPPTDETKATPPSETTASEPAQAPVAGSDTETQAPAAPAQDAKPADAILAANAAAQPAEIADDPVVCKRVEVTGTRLRKGKVCKTKREWRAMADSAQSMMKDVDRKTSTGVGGQSLPPGG